MQYPRIVKSPSLTRVFGSWKEGNSQFWLERVNEVFGTAISVNVEGAFPESIAVCRVNPLEWQVLEELGNILICSRNNWKYWTVELVEKTIPKLVEACIWKNEILSEQSYYRDVVNNYAVRGLEILTGLSDYLTLYSNDRKPSTRRTLVRKYLEPPYTGGDSRAVLIRALRCFITFRISRKPKSELVFKFGPDLRLSLWGRTFNKYLYEQLCLYIYLFKNQEEAHFFIEHRQQLINFVSARLPDYHEDLAEVIVGETFDYLIKRRNCYSESQENIWIDTGLDTYFIGNILSSKRIQRFWEKKRKFETQNSSETVGTVEGSPEDRVSVKPKKSEKSEGYSLSPAFSERDRLLRHYIDQLEPACKSYFYWEFFGIQSENSEQLKLKELDGISTPCLAKIKTLLIDNGYYDLFIK